MYVVPFFLQWMNSLNRIIYCNVGAWYTEGKADITKLPAVGYTERCCFSMRRRKGLTFYQKKRKISNQNMKEAASWLFLVVLAVLVAFVCVYSIGIRTSVIGNSMEPSLSGGQEILIDRIRYNIMSPKKGEVVVFKPNGNENAHYYVKRVFGVPGDKILIEDGILYVNGESCENEFSDKIEDAGVAKEEITLGMDEFFVMGDNCNSSEDSRSGNIGNVNKTTIVGMAWLHMASATEGIGRIK